MAETLTNVSFAGMDVAKSNETGQFFSAGKFEVEIQKFSMIKTRKGEEQFLAQYQLKKIIAGGENMSVGTSYSNLINKKLDGFLGYVKNVLLPAYAVKFKKKIFRAGMGLDAAQCIQDAQITDKLAEAAISDAQPLRGVAFWVEAVQIKTKEGKDFTRLTYFPENPWSNVAQQKAATAQVEELSL